MSLIRMKRGPKEIAEEFVEEVKKKYKDDIVETILFGSVAKGTENDFSDIDMFIICKKNRFKLRRKIMGISIKFLLNYGVYISVKTLTQDEFNRLRHTGFINQISQEGIVIG